MIINRQFYSGLIAILIFSLSLRLLFYTGILGSDEAPYNGMALEILNGTWSVSNYIGAIRYGVNIPVALFMSLFGVSEWSANLWSLTCSLAEILLIFVFTNRLFSLRIAIFSTLVLATLPLHVHYAGRMMADAPLAFFLTLSFCAFFWAERTENTKWYLIAGLSLGFSYWIKEIVTILTIPVFIAYAAFFRKLDNKWLLFIAGAFALLLANMALMWVITSDPLHVFHVQISSFNNNEALASERITSVSYYFRYLFLDVKHTWLLGPLVILGVIKIFCLGKTEEKCNLLLVSLWGGGMLFMLTFMIVSLNPFTLIFKQTNYMLVFAAPLAILSGYGLSKINRVILYPLLALLVIGSIILSSFEQQVIRSFVANSKAASYFAESVDHIPVFGTKNAHTISYEMAAFGDISNTNIIRPLNLFNNDINSLTTHINGVKAYVILDTETVAWEGSKNLSPQKVPGCWKLYGALEPTGFGSGKTLLSLLRTWSVSILPAQAADLVLSATNSFYQPKDAFIYTVPAKCDALIQEYP